MISSNKDLTWRRRLIRIGGVSFVLFWLIINSRVLLADDENDVISEFGCQEMSFQVLESKEQEEVVNLAGAVINQTCLEHERGFASPYSNLINRPQSSAASELMFVNRETRDTAQRMLDWLDIYQSH